MKMKPCIAAAALLCLATPVAAKPAYGTAVDQKCTANGWVPARPYNPNNLLTTDPTKVNCGLCHANALNPNRTMNAAGAIYKASGRTDVSPFCQPPAPMNHAPVFAPIAAQQATVGQLLQLAVSASDADRDAIALSVSNSPAGATFSDGGNGSGSFRWTPTASDAGTTTVTFHATDAGSPMASSTLDVAISVGTPPNRAPVLAPIGDRQVDPGVTLLLTLAASDLDGDALTFAATPLPDGASLDGAQLTWTPAAGQEGNHPLTVTVNDDGSPSLSDSEAIVISVGRVNRPPQLSPVGDRSVDLGQVARIALVATDADGDVLALSCNGLPGEATLTDLRDGTGEIVWAPTAAGSYAVTCSAADNGLPPGSDAETFMLSARDPAPPAGAPVLTDARWSRAHGAGSLRVVGMLPEAGMTAEGTARVEVFARLADGAAVKLGARSAAHDGAFHATLRSFIAPCAVTAAANGLMGAPQAVEGAPSGCGETPLMSVRAKQSCDGFTLRVKGRRAPADALITGTDPATGDVLFTHATTRPGSFHLRSRTPGGFVHALQVTVSAGGATWTLPEAVPVRGGCN